MRASPAFIPSPGKIHTKQSRRNNFRIWLTARVQADFLVSGGPAPHPRPLSPKRGEGGLLLPTRMGMLSPVALAAEQFSNPGHNEGASSVPPLPCTQGRGVGGEGLA